jgi:8-oxo-dGTP diphosphatase
MKLVTAAIIRNENCVLLTRRKKGQKLEGYWEFPGGKIEKDETPQSCLERELLEELCVEAIAGEIITESIYQYSHGIIKLLAIETVLLSEKIQLSVHDKAEWVPVENLCSFKLAPADVHIAKILSK